MTKKYGEYMLLAAVLAAVFGVYLFTMHPAFKNNDSPETTAAALTLGICHPPAYPLYSMAGKLFTYIPAGNFAFRINMFSSFLAVMILLVTYFILVKYVLKLFISPGLWAYRALGLGSVALLAFSFIFWNQGVEAKGGIYMLNLFFLALMTYISLEVFEKPAKKLFYLFSFIFGLSLANHWPSMIILAPVFAFLFIEYGRLIKFKGLAVCGLFFIAGLTPYIYLLVRANSGAVFNWGDPKDLEGFLWVVLRQGYTGPVEANAHVFKYQIKEFISLLVTDYSVFFIMAFAGAYALYLKAGKFFRYLISIFIIVSVMVVFYNRTKEGVVYLLDIFLIPAMYVCFLFITAGAAFLSGRIREKKAVFFVSCAAALAVFLFMGYRHFEKNNSSRDFLSYDFGKAILNTMETGSVYLADGDFNLMPVYYLQDIMKQRQDVITVTDSFLIFDWGIKDFVSKHGSVPMKPFDAANNEKNVIERFIGKNSVYRSGYFPRFENFNLPYASGQAGLLIKITDKYESHNPRVFELYSYRGIYDKFCVLNPANLDLVGWYAVSMVNHANALNQSGRAREAIGLYRKALLFPNKKPAANIYFNIALAYEKMSDFDSELIYLFKAIDEDGNLLVAIEKAGIISYEKAFYISAKELFLKAVSLGSNNEMVKKGLDILNSMSEPQMLESMLIKANEYIEKKELQKALKIYDFLLEKHYKSDIINRNIGVYHFRTEDYDKAVEYFTRSKNETQSADTYLYTAYAYFKLNKLDKAIAELEQGTGHFKEDKKLKDLLVQLKEQKKRNEKNSDSNYRQR